MTPRNLSCWENMVIVTHSVSWSDSNCLTQPKSMQAIQEKCEGKSSCYVELERSFLGNPCPDERWLDFKMYYSCQTGKKN